MSDPIYDKFSAAWESYDNSEDHLPSKRLAERFFRLGMAQPKEAPEDASPLSEDTSASPKNIDRAFYILNHYGKTDVIALARDLDRYDAGRASAPAQREPVIGELYLNTKRDRDELMYVYVRHPEGCGYDVRVKGFFEEAKALAFIESCRPQREPVSGKLWLWKNFVDGKPEYLAFDNPFPVHMHCDDPQTLGEPCGYAYVKESRCGRDDVSEEEVLRRIESCRPQREPVIGEFYCETWTNGKEFQASVELKLPARKMVIEQFDTEAEALAFIESCRQPSAAKGDGWQRWQLANACRCARISEDDFNRILAYLPIAAPQPKNGE